MLPLEQPAVALCLVAAGLLFLSALLLGVWKYLAMAGSETATAPYYVDIAHRAALLYSFAALLLGVLAAHSAWSETVDFWAAALPLAFFALAIGTYVVHGAFNQTDNQFRRPRRLGPMPLPDFALHGFMIALIAAEFGGAAVLVAGVVKQIQS